MHSDVTPPLPVTMLGNLASLQKDNQKVTIKYHMKDKFLYNLYKTPENLNKSE